MLYICTCKMNDPRFEITITACWVSGRKTNNNEEAILKWFNCPYAGIMCSKTYAYL